MRRGGEPSRRLESAIAKLIPAPVREEVLGDLYERYESPGQYLSLALRVIPLVVFSRIRRTTDFELSLTVGLLVYLCYLSAAWWSGEAAAVSPARLAAPAAATLLGILIADAYAVPSAFGAAIVMLTEIAMAWVRPGWALPVWLILIAGSAGLVLATRLLMVVPVRPCGGGGGGVARHVERVRSPSWLWLPFAVAIIIGGQLLKKWWMGQ